MLETTSKRGARTINAASTGPAYAEQPLRIGQRRLKNRALPGLARIGDYDLVRRLQPRQFVCRQFVQNQHLLAQRRG
jgi:hypothetical protein